MGRRETEPDTTVAKKLIPYVRQVYRRRRSGRMRTKEQERNSLLCTLSHEAPAKKPELTFRFSFLGPKAGSGHYMLCLAKEDGAFFTKFLPLT